MDHSIIQFFTRHVIFGRVTNGNASLPHPSSYDADNPTSSLRLDERLLRLLHQVATLHFAAARESALSSTTICAAVDIWSSLDSWPRPAHLSPEDHEVHEQYASALFIWLHLIIHPNHSTDDKIQAMVSTGLERLAEFDSTSEHWALLLVPLFIHGVASVEESDRDAVEDQFLTLEEHGHVRDTTLDTIQRVVHWTWDRQNHRVDRSWDWTDWGGADLV